MEFKNPIFFILLLALVPYILWYVLKYKRSLPSLKVPETVKYRMAPKSFRLYLFHVPFLLRLVLFTLVVCILARPQSKHTWSDTDVEGIDIMLAVDVSTSMLAQDFKPNRVEALKAIAQQFIERRPNDNMGLTIFAGEAYTQCPLTTDHAVLMNLYSSVDCNMAARGIIDDGTAIGDGIMNAILRLKDSQAKSKVIILLTDGVNNSGNISPTTAAEIAQKYGIRIYDVDMENGYLHEKKQIEITNSSYVTISHNRKYLYSITDFGVESYKIIQGGDLEPISMVSINGMRGSHLSTDYNDEYLFVCSYHDGKITLGAVSGYCAGLLPAGAVISNGPCADPTTVCGNYVWNLCCNTSYQCAFTAAYGKWTLVWDAGITDKVGTNLTEAQAKTGWGTAVPVKLADKRACKDVACSVCKE